MSKLKNIDIANAIRIDASPEYQSIVPEATSANGAEVMQVLADYPTQKNIFINTLVNKVVMSTIFNKKWENPLKAFKKGQLPFGGNVEQLFVADATRKAFGSHFEGSTTDEGDALGKVVPKIDASYISVNFMNKYKVTISDAQLQTAFVSEDGLSNLVGSLVQSIYEGAEVDEYGYMKYCLYDMIGDIASQSTTEKSSASFVSNGATPWEADKLLVKLRAMSGRLNFKSTKYNKAGVNTFTKREKLVLLTTPEKLAELDVEALGVLFNLSKGELDYRIVEVDELPTLSGSYTVEMGDTLVNPSTGITAPQNPYVITDEKIAGMHIEAIVCDEDAFQMYDTVVQTRSIDNPNSLSTNIIHHRQGIAGGNPYANIVCFGYNPEESK